MKLREYLETEQVVQTDFAKQIGVSAVTLNHWKQGVRPIPLKYCYSIEMATKGKVSRIDIRPNDWWEIWPDLKKFMGQEETQD